MAQSSAEDVSTSEILSFENQMLREHRNIIRVGILGMPNSGKTGVFNLLTNSNSDVDVGKLNASY